MDKRHKDDEVCHWCGDTYAEHEVFRGPNDAVPKMPCTGLKSGFLPRRAKEQREEKRKPLLIVLEDIWSKSFPVGSDGSLGWALMPHEHVLRAIQKLIQAYWYERESDFQHRLRDEVRQAVSQTKEEAYMQFKDALVKVLESKTSPKLIEAILEDLDDERQEPRRKTK